MRAINNLLSNALKYSKKHTIVTVEIYKKIVREKVYAVVSISNTPIEPVSGIEIKKFFQRLYKKDKSRSHEGSGLGLAITQEILRLHNGLVDAYIEDERVIFKLFFIQE